MAKIKRQRYEFKYKKCKHCKKWESGICKKWMIPTGGNEYPCQKFNYKKK